MKPAIAYGIIGSPYSRLRVIAITSETKGGRGRDQDGRPTNATARDCRGRFDTLELAEQARTAVQDVFDRHAPLVAEARERLETATAQRKYAVDNALRALPGLPVAALEPAPAS